MKNRSLPILRLETRALDDVPDDEYHFRGCMSSDLLDAYKSRMGESSLSNFVSDASKGVPFQDSHSSESIRTLGRSFQAELDDGAQAYASIRMLRDDADTPDHMRVNEYIRRIRAGIYSSLSVGFHSERNICGICDGTIAIGWERFWGGDEFCEHNVGDTYDGKECTYTIEDARLAEISLVTTPANPDAEIIERASSGNVPPRTPDTPVDPLVVEAGELYRDRLIELAVKAGIRAEGTAFNKEQWEPQLRLMSVDALQSLESSWQALGDARWGSQGRITRDALTPAPERVGQLLPAYLVN